MEVPLILNKLRLSNTHKTLIVNAPAGYTLLLDGIKYDKKPEKGIKKQYDFIQVFARSQSELERLIIEAAPSAKHDCLFWACYPKATGKIKSDIKRETVWKAFDLINLQAVSQVAIDDTWSAMRARPSNAIGK